MTCSWREFQMEGPVTENIVLSSNFILVFVVIRSYLDEQYKWLFVTSVMCIRVWKCVVFATGYFATAGERLVWGDDEVCQRPIVVVWWRRLPRRPSCCWRCTCKWWLSSVIPDGLQNHWYIVVCHFHNCNSWGLKQRPVGCTHHTRLHTVDRDLHPFNSGLCGVSILSCWRHSSRLRMPFVAGGCAQISQVAEPVKGALSKSYLKANERP